VVATPNAQHHITPILIERDNQPINGNNNTVAVGQQINLTLYAPGLNNITNYQWTIPGTSTGTAFKDYQPTATNSNYTPLLPTDLNGPNVYSVSFYWSDAADNRQILCTFTLNGQNYTIPVTLNIQRPLAGISASTNGAIAVDTNYGYPGPPSYWLHFGENIGTNNGVSFSQTNSPAPGGFTGQFRYVQTASVAITNSPSYNPVSVTSPAGTNIDTTFPYDYPDAGGVTAYDSPADPYIDSTNQTTTEKFHATMYLYWQAYSTNSVVNGDKTVYVPLRGVNWSWSATATNTSGTWTLVPGSVNYPTNLNDFPVTNEVQWLNNATNFITVP
jgi:hypothetical protein